MFALWGYLCSDQAVWCLLCVSLFLVNSVQRAAWHLLRRFLELFPMDTERQVHTVNEALFVDELELYNNDMNHYRITWSMNDYTEWTFFPHKRSLAHYRHQLTESKQTHKFNFSLPSTHSHNWLAIADMFAVVVICHLKQSHSQQCKKIKIKCYLCLFTVLYFKGETRDNRFIFLPSQTEMIGFIYKRNAHIVPPSYPEKSDWQPNPHSFIVYGKLLICCIKHAGIPGNLAQTGDEARGWGKFKN